MINQKKVVAIIPARGGSKRLPGKNLLPLAGKPLIAWSIAAAKESRYVDTVVVSTDDDCIMAVANEFGAETPFRRPAEIASDTATSSAVLLHAIAWLQQNQRPHDIVIMLQPTSPLRSAADIDSALELLMAKNAQGVVSVCACEHSPLWANTLPADGSMGDFLPESIRGLRSQDLPAYYRLNGALYLFNIPSLVRAGGIFYTNDTFAFRMERNSSVDIDTMDDFQLAEFLLGSSRA
jgi:CMP-N,N'-diacetyllegionaminic acid synthase